MQKTAIANKQWVSPNETAGFLGVCTKTLRLHDQALKPAYLNSRVKRYHLPSLENFWRTAAFHDGCSSFGRLSCLFVFRKAAKRER